MKQLALLSILCAAFYFSQASAQVSSNEGNIGGVQAMQTDADKNKNAADEFLKNNAKKQGVVTLPDGLQYKVIKQGTGPKPSDQDSVTVDYEGTLTNGTEFDSSYKRGVPATFPVSGVIPGWTEALKLMNAGSIWMLYIPPSLAYGEHGAPPSIGPNEALIFKVHLISVKKS